MVVCIYDGRPLYEVSQVPRHHQKHAQSTYLDEYLRFKKNLVEKFPLDIFLEQFVRAKPKMHGFYLHLVEFNHFGESDFDFPLMY